MKKHYPSREKDRWEHALTRPVSSHIKFELLELMRADLFEYLDLLTTDPYNDKKSRATRDAEIQRIADRLKELTPFWEGAARAAMKAGRVEHAYVSHADEAGPQCGPFSASLWEELYQQRENAR